MFFRRNSHHMSAIWAFVLVPIVIVVTTEAFKTNLVWRLRVVDFIDLVFTAPFFLIMLLYLNHNIFRGKKEGKLYLISLSMMALTLYGHAMHLTGNAINTYSTEIYHYQDIIPPDVYELIYFFDEVLGHWLFYIGLFGSLGIWIMADYQDQLPSWKDYTVGVILGTSYAIAIIESSQPILGLLISFWLLTCTLISVNISGDLSLNSLRNKLSQSVWMRIGITVALVLPITEVLYLIIFGGFFQPSQLGL